MPQTRIRRDQLDGGFRYGCPLTVAVGDAVYLSASNTVNKASAESGGGQTADAIGIVISKPTTTTAIVVGEGVVDAFVGLTVGATYYLSDTTPGGVTTPAPGDPGEKIQEIGIAVSATKLYVDPDETSIIL